MAKAKRRAKPRRTSSAGRPAGGKVGAGRGKTPARSVATVAGKAKAVSKGTKGSAKVASKRPVVAPANTAKVMAKVTAKAPTKGGGSPPKLAPTRALPVGEMKAPSATAPPRPAAPPKPAAPRKPEARLATATGGKAAADANRLPGEGAASEKTSETTAQGFAPAAPGEAQQNGGSAVGLPVPIASFTI